MIRRSRSAAQTRLEAGKSTHFALLSFSLAFVLAVPGPKYHHDSEAETLRPHAAAPEADSSKPGSSVVTLCPCTHAGFSFSSPVFLDPSLRFQPETSCLLLHFWSLWSESLHQFGPGEARHPQMTPGLGGKRIYFHYLKFLLLFFKSNPASSRKRFRGGRACHIRSASVENTPADCLSELQPPVELSAD